MLREQVAVWEDAILAWNGECPERLNAIMETIRELAEGEQEAEQEHDVQNLCGALLCRKDIGLLAGTLGELHFYIGAVETRDLSYRNGRLEEAKWWFRKADPSDNYVWRWTEKIHKLQRAIFDGQPRRPAPTAGEQSSADDAMETGEAVEEAETATETTGQTFTLTLRPAGMTFR